MNVKRAVKWAVSVASAGLVLAVLSGMDLSARPGSCCGKGMPQYDPATEISLSGTVEEVVTMTGCCAGRTGTHVMLRAGSDIRELALGPSDYLKAQKFEVAKGDALEVTGATAECHGSHLVLARTLKAGDRTLTLRDADGVPAWRGRR